MHGPRGAGVRSNAKAFLAGWLALGGVLVLLAVHGLSTPGSASGAATAADAGPSVQAQADVDRKSAGCISCHTPMDEPTMHATGTVRLGCTDCHGGDAGAATAPGASLGSPEYQRVKKEAHVKPRLARFRNTSKVPERAYTNWLQESAAYVRFVNPGDLRVAAETCGAAGCHPREVRSVSTSMMNHSGFLWGAALYNNGAYPLKDAHFGESYAADGTPQTMKTAPPPSPEETRAKGVLKDLQPLERWEVSQPGNVLRVFERGGRKKDEIGNPNRDDDSGRPNDKLGERGFGTLLRTDPVFLGLQKTRLLDPLLSLPGTNDHPGDYRAGGCSACHVVYANDRAAAHSGPYAAYGHAGTSASADPVVPKSERGHPIRHAFTRAIPSSQCMVCHIHPGTNMVAGYFGYTWWDNEVDGEAMYPKQQRNPTEQERYNSYTRNPEGSAALGLWSDEAFLEKTGSPEFNAKLKNTQFADFHGHGWVFRAVYKHDRKGNLLDTDGRMVSIDDPKKFEKAVHLDDIHLEKGMHCVDCHFQQDSHGNGKLYGEPRAAIEIDCTNCHGTVRSKATLVTSGPAAPAGGTHLEALRTPSGERRFDWRGGKLFQRSMLEPGKEWEIVQVLDTITPGNPHFNEKSQRAKTLLRDGKTWGGAPGDELQLAHANSRMTCYACHTSWTTSCFGCHLQMTANVRRPMLHNEGLLTRNYTTYNFQVLRDDIFMLAVDGTVTANRVAPARSSCAILVSSQNQNRDWLYYTQQTVSAEGFSGQAFSTFVPHTVRAKETRQCSDCHVSSAGDNNAWMAQTLLQGTNFLNFLGPYIYVAMGKKGFEAVAVAEHDEPEAIIGSDLQRIAYPDDYRKHLARGRRLMTAHRHAGEVFDVQLRGEYLYAAAGKRGFRAYDVANVDNKGFSERVVTAPVSLLGQRLYVRTRDAVAVASPTTLAIDPLRTHRLENEERPIHPLYGFLYVADRQEGLVVVGDSMLKGKNPGVGTLLDGNPENNFLKRALAYNPDGILNGARRIAIAGVYAYVLCDRGLVVVSLEDPLAPRLVATIGPPELVEPRGIAVQFRYAFVADREGLKVLDVTRLDQPRMARGALIPLPDARNVYVARTYAYVSAGRQGLAIVDVERPEQPRLDQVFTAGGEMNDVNDVKVGMVAASAYAFVADGVNGLRVLQIVSPWDDPHFAGFSPRPMPKMIASYRTSGPALAISKGIDRDRAVDESGNQLAVFGRRGARPLDLAEQQRLYLRDGDLYSVSDEPSRPAPATSWIERTRRTFAWLIGAGP